MAIKRLLLLSGAIGAGKTSVAAALNEKHGFSRISSGGYLRALAEVAGTSGTRLELQRLGDELDVETDFRWIVNAVASPSIEVSSGVENWLLDAVRKPRQIQHFRSRFDRLVRHVHLVAPEDVLMARYQKRMTHDDVAYDRAIAHPNEVAARSLGPMADQIFDTAQSSPTEISARILELWKE